MPTSVHTHTPSLKVTDCRGLTVRNVNFHRAIIGEQVEARIESQTFDVAGHLATRRDPRLFTAFQGDPSAPANITNVFSLSSALLFQSSVDAGWKARLSGSAGNDLDTWDARGTYRRLEYDSLLRPSAAYEQMADRQVRACERLSYIAPSEAASALNLCGVLHRCDDGAGSHFIDACNILGVPKQQRRRFLKSLELPDWPDDTEQRDALLGPDEGSKNTDSMGPTGDLLAQTDASGNRRSFAYDTAGLLSRVELTLASTSTPRVLLHSLSYDAFGNLESQTAGNNVTSHARFSMIDCRLQELITCRSATTPLQHLVYGYDPAGNIVNVLDQAQPARHFKNQQIQALNSYEHDSLYQLVKATGRESSTAAIQPGLPTPISLLTDTSQLLNYTQHYRYDEAGNMLELRHEGQQAYTRRMWISPFSNRALAWEDDSAPPDADNLFDACGNLQKLTQQSLQWDGLNQLTQMDVLTRNDGNNDSESYFYDSDGQRLRKIAMSSAKSIVHTREVRYLPGLEIRMDTANGEHLEVITVQAGRNLVRCMHWVCGKPEQILNDQLRYSVDDHLGSCTLELDNEARLISYEGYYPFGVTAWWATRSVVEASYKTVRYSGKERDGGGLYYYGLRYYAPWLARWINPDPLGMADGSNLYQMVNNNPVNRVDVQGGHSMEFGVYDIFLFLGIAMGIGVLIYALHEIQRAYSLRQDPRLDLYRKLKLKYDIQLDEFLSLDEFVVNHYKNSQLVLHEDEATQQPSVFVLSSAKQLSFFNQHKSLHGFLTSQFARNTPHFDFKRATLLPQSHASPRAPGTLTAFRTNESLWAPSTGSSPVKRNKKHRASAAPAKSDEPSVQNMSALAGKIPLQRVSEEDVEAYFNTSDFLKQEPKYEGLRGAVRAAIENVERGRGNLHKVTKNTYSVDLPGLGGQTGRGAWRLLLKRKENGFAPHSIVDTH
ncbi:insecticidal toxin complex protein TccC [Pseudomonas sp. NFACC02]|uniref:RHS repeat domain-containing protein n=1 Tax=Pseudomonas sp. NFACC02 TaxID=1566250 RepID=UPI0008AD75A7|nr:RHS repeat-associated core domain-containing protein [Pseudomonas sp. NFACC02]SER03061.1 insecticidal toxin complex protein TccC [Pseudomonas sp. NFACC02]